MYADVPQSQPSTNVKGRRRRLRLLMIVVICVACWGGTKWFEQRSVILSQLEELERLEEKYEETKQLNEEYKFNIARLSDPEYKEQILRKEFHMIKEGERLFIRTE